MTVIENLMKYLINDFVVYYIRQETNKTGHRQKIMKKKPK